MKLVSFRNSPEAAARLGVLEGRFVVDVEKLGKRENVPLPGSMLDLIQAGPHTLTALEDILQRCERRPVDGTVPVDNVTLLAPIPRPRKNIFGIGLNYVEHVEESSRSLDTSKALPDRPMICSRSPSGRLRTHSQNRLESSGASSRSRMISAKDWVWQACHAAAVVVQSVISCAREARTSSSVNCVA